MVDSYNLLPDIIKRQAELNFGTSAVNIIQNLCGMIDEEFNEVAKNIVGILTNLDIQNCDLSILKYIGSLVGEAPDPGWTEIQQREFVKSLVTYVKIKGTQRNAVLRAKLKYDDDLHITELFKTEPYEDTDYSATKDPVHYLKSARIEICINSCETYCEVSDETYSEDEYPNGFSTPDDAQDYIDSLGDVLPVHVRVKKNFRTEDVLDLFENTEDNIGCTLSCESVCETDCETTEELSDGSQIQGDFSDLFGQVGDTLEILTSCVYVCETNCEDCCQCWGYSTIPDSTGEVYATEVGYFEVRMHEKLPDTECCLSICEAACEAGTAQTDSIAVVDGYNFFLHHIWYIENNTGTEYFRYRFYLVSGEDLSWKDWNHKQVLWAQNAVDCSGNPLTASERESACSFQCEDGSCQSWCETECESGCEVVCEGTACETYCMTYCMANCESACQAGFCTVGCEYGCETGTDNDILLVEGGVW